MGNNVSGKKGQVQLRYTGETWGQNQLLAYRDKIDNALQTI